MSFRLVVGTKLGDLGWPCQCHGVAAGAI